MSALREHVGNLTIRKILVRNPSRLLPAQFVSRRNAASVLSMSTRSFSVSVTATRITSFPTWSTGWAAGRKAPG